MENKIISIKSTSDAKKFISGLNNSPIVLDITIQNDDYDCIKYLAKHSQKIQENIKIINLNLPYELLPKKDFEVLYSLSTALPNTKCNVFVNHGYIDDENFMNEKGVISWDIQTIIKANKSIYNVCNFIKTNCFSPFEAYAYIHKYVSTIAKYNTSSVGERWLKRDQYFMGAYLDLPEVVCMGYSSLEKEIIDTLNMPGLKCDVVSVSFYNKDKSSYDHHARCFVQISDKKYGIEQTCFEDATWDNTEPQFGEIPKYAHFAMDNNCHERPVNDKYDYNYPSLIEFSPKNVKNIYDYNPYRTYNKSENPISQLQIEKAYFNVLTKSKPNLTFEDLYSYLSQMAKQSYDEQLSRRFKGNLVQEKPLLTKQMAKHIFDQNRQNSHDCDLLETGSSQEL